MPHSTNLSILSLLYIYITLSVLNKEGTQKENKVFVTSEDLVFVANHYLVWIANKMQTHFLPVLG